jgi:hypothetical protein
LAAFFTFFTAAFLRAFFPFWTGLATVRSYNAASRVLRGIFLAQFISSFRLSAAFFLAIFFTLTAIAFALAIFLAMILCLMTLSFLARTWALAFSRATTALILISFLTTLALA